MSLITFLICIQGLYFDMFFFHYNKINLSHDNTCACMYGCMHWGLLKMKIQAKLNFMQKKKHFLIVNFINLLMLRAFHVHH